MQRLVRNIPYPGVPYGVHLSPLCLQPGSQDIQRVDDRSPERSRRGSHNSRHERARLRVFLVYSVPLGLVGNVGCFKKLEGAHVDRGIRKHAYETHSHAAVGRTGSALGQHFTKGLQK